MPIEPDNLKALISFQSKMKKNRMNLILLNEFPAFLLNTLKKIETIKTRNVKLIQLQNTK